MKDMLGQRMKEYEGIEAKRMLDTTLPVLARVDGKNFSSLTHDLEKPFDSDFHEAMLHTACRLVEYTGALVGYVQSDEISLLFYTPRSESQIYFNGRPQKMIGDLAAYTTLVFNDYLRDHFNLWEYSKQLPRFDARVWNVPTKLEVSNTFLWRGFDAKRNSIQMVGQAYFSPKQLHGKNSDDILRMLKEINHTWEAYPVWSKYGEFVQRRHVLRPFSSTEIEKLPLKHDARKNPDLKVERTSYITWYIDFSEIINKVGFLFEEEDPIVY